MDYKERLTKKYNSCMNRLSTSTDPVVMDRLTGIIEGLTMALNTLKEDDCLVLDELSAENLVDEISNYTQSVVCNKSLGRMGYPKEICVDFKEWCHDNIEDGEFPKEFVEAVSEQLKGVMKILTERMLFPDSNEFNYKKEKESKMNNAISKEKYLEYINNLFNTGSITHEIYSELVEFADTFITERQEECDESV